MHICTFYSFKGGVGRTLALANVATQLASEGRRVLLVDFDLEAPGLGSFELLKTKTEAPGIVDYVSHFLNHNSAPNVSDYVAEAGLLENILVMKSGEFEPNYATRMANIDWIKLYDQQDGYLLFEDMKAQWQKELNPDYVFIDSHTGYTDTVGICTRQLPDAVTILIFPNEQNLYGLKQIVSNIRGEATTSRQKTIDLYFVMSNVPYLDDEDQILDGITQEFKHQLEIEELMTIHRYDSLQLIQQSVFTQERPNSRLAHEYRRLARRIVQGNLESKEGALYYLEALREILEDESRVTYKPNPLDETLKLLEIENRFSDDIDISVQLAHLWLGGGTTIPGEEHGLHLASNILIKNLDSISEEDQISLLDAITELGGSYFGHHTAVEALHQESLPLRTVKRLLNLLEGSSQISMFPAISSLTISDKLELGASLERLGSLNFSNSVLNSIISDDDIDSRNITKAAKSLLARNYIARHRFVEALHTYSRDGLTTRDMSLLDAFFYASALWGDTKEYPQSVFEQICDMAISEHRNDIVEEQGTIEHAFDVAYEFSSTPKRNSNALYDEHGSLIIENEERLQLLLLIGRITRSDELTWDKLQIDLMLDEFLPSRISLRFSFWSFEYVLFNEFTEHTHAINTTEFDDSSRVPFLSQAQARHGVDEVR